MKKLTVSRKIKLFNIKMAGCYFKITNLEDLQKVLNPGYLEQLLELDFVQEIEDPCLRAIDWVLRGDLVSAEPDIVNVIVYSLTDFESSEITDEDIEQFKTKEVKEIVAELVDYYNELKREYGGRDVIKFYNPQNHLFECVSKSLTETSKEYVLNTLWRMLSQLYNTGKLNVDWIIYIGTGARYRIEETGETDVYVLKEIQRGLPPFRRHIRRFEHAPDTLFFDTSTFCLSETHIFRSDLKEIKVEILEREILQVENEIIRLDELKISEKTKELNRMTYEIIILNLRNEIKSLMR